MGYFTFGSLLRLFYESVSGNDKIPGFLIPKS